MELLGGQAVIEGVMIRKGSEISVAVRKPNKKIVVKKEKLNLLSAKLKYFYFVRGIVSLFEMLYLGAKTLSYSANQAATDGKKETFSLFHFLIIFIVSLTIALLVFKLLPLFLAQLITSNLTDSNIIFNVVDGLIKILLFVAYVYGISFMSDIQELFKYHGAEHKTISCYESKKKLTVDNVKKFSTIHPRCGTSFVMLVLLISIIVYTFIPKDFTLLEKFLYRIILLPLIAGISYEFLKISDKMRNNLIFKLITYPGLLLQKITTREPTDDQIRVALAAIKPLS